MQEMLLKMPEKNIELIEAAARAEGYATVEEFLYVAACDSLVAIVES